ncbi:MAG: NUDIX domain-containing protein [Pseudomonadota bacterium]
MTVAAFERYRENVGILVTDGSGNVLVGNLRRDPLVWIMPQGGIHPGETPEQAMYRELEEETGIKPGEVSFIAKTQNAIRYKFREPMRLDGSEYSGQEQIWFILNIIGNPGLQVPMDDEFLDLRWAEPSWVLRNVSAYKIAVYEEVFDYFGKWLS